MGKFATGILLSAVICVFVGMRTLSYARPSGDLASFAQEQMRNFQRDMVTAEAVLKAKAPEAWTAKELEDYLFNAFYAIYNATNSYTFTNRHVPSSWEVLRDSGPLSPWPGNPLNNWEPIKWDTPSAEFSPGDLVMQVCGPELYSTPKNPAPMSYELSINGPTEDYDPINPIEFVPPSWAITPRGTVFLAGLYVEPASKVRKKQEAAKKAREAEQAEKK